MIAELQEMIEANFPATSDTGLIRGITEGIMLADQLRKSDPILQTVIGKNLTGHLRRAGVMWRLHQLCGRGELPFKASFEQMSIGSWNHLVLRTSEDLVSNLCRTESAQSFPKDTPNRQDERLSNQPDLFAENIVSFNAALEQVSEKCVWLTYGYMPDGNLTHACWAMPSPASNVESWHAHVNIVERLRRSGQPEKTKPKGLDPSMVLKFKREIDEALQAPDKNKQEKD